MERARKSFKWRSWRKVITCLLTCCMFLNMSLPAALAGPVGGVVDTNPINGGGNAAITYGAGTYGNTTQVAVETKRTIINWESLNTVGGTDVTLRETLEFSQGSLTNSAVLNRISGGMTQFDGDLNAPGMRIFMINPAGIMFGNGSTVNVTQLVASGLGMTNEAFNNYIADPVNTQMEFVGGDGKVTNVAAINNADSVYLIGKKVVNGYAIMAPGGVVVMAAGDEVRLLQDGSNVSVVVNTLGDGLSAPDVMNRSQINVGDGKIVLAAGDTFSRAISNVALLNASGGEVEMQASIVANVGGISVSRKGEDDGDGGSISLNGIDEVVIGPSPYGLSYMYADAGPNGNGGEITIQSEGKVTIDENTLTTARGGSISGNGGTVTITCDDFEIAGDIDASPGNKINEPGKLVINTPNVIIANGANGGVMDTIYEEDIEALSNDGTSLIVNAEEGITVKDITDGIGDADPGIIDGRFGSIELHATGENSAVTFADETDTIRTSLGDIIIEAGSGGIKVGNLITGKDLADEKPAVGQIKLTTKNGGDIEAENLLIENGWGHAEINVEASGNLTVNGDVKVGSESAILNVPPHASAEAMIYLSAGDNVLLEGDVTANAHGLNEAVDTTKAYIGITAGTNQNLTGDATINGDLAAYSKASSNGTSEATIEIDTWGNLFWGTDAADPVADADKVLVTGKTSDEETDPEGDKAQIIINAQDYPTPRPIGMPDNFSTPKSTAAEIDVLVNDTQGGELMVDGSIDSYTDPTAGTLVPIEAGDEIVGFTYNPPEDLSTLTFNESGEATVTFTYVARSTDGMVSLNPTTVTITLTNGLPTAIKDEVKTYIGMPVSGNVLTNDIDADLGDILSVVAGTITTENGVLVLNEDGTFTYTPNENFVGTDNFTYSATDSFNTSAEVGVIITISEAPPAPPAVPSIPAVPGLERMRIDVQASGCPALVKWAAEEVGIDQRMVQIWITNSLASTGDIQPCDACAELKNSAQILQDADGSHIAAMARVVGEFASSNTPPTEEQIASIADAIARNTDEDSYYAVAGEYLDALATYVGVLSNEMGFSAVESVQFVTDKYVGRLAQGDNVGVATFIAANLAALGG